ncbi:integrase catalytic domain-containing protein [Trichonephila inaurata madagascariensis]|uniref:Integrase catalytic domain-containing protein n=1 Tax=Trichonephila inaurata madagascariensis TaxID=2747483 RepID=A0A8X6YQ05_9ARAC|nr:integrase catalytic domain-containing protein [Trichonephila inaurata madagascariensis]
MHASENCCEAASVIYDVKKNAVIKKSVCYDTCSQRGHMSHSCRSDVKCIICNKRHYAVLCSKLPLRSGLETESASVENSMTASSSSSNVLANQACTSEVLLQTLVVVLQNGIHRSSELESQPDNFETMVLGLIWNLKDDCLSCKINCQKNEDHQEINKRIRHVQTIREQLRKRFRIEYLGQLREQTQRHRKSRPLTVGEVVVVENSLKNRTLWSLARVIQLIPGKDGHIRVARVKTETGELVRPVQRLYNLELQEPEISLPKDLTDSVIRTRRGRKVTTPKRLTYA